MEKILFCPQCGADCSSIEYGDWNNNKCPYCGHEIYDYSVEKNQSKIQDVMSERKKLLSLPAKVAVIIILTLLVLFGFVAVYYLTGANNAVEYQIEYGKADKYTRKMEKCYKKKDWDGLYKIVIDDCMESISSPAYFTYRSAWILSCYPDDFDKAYEQNDIEKMREIYSFISEDYEMRNQDIFDAVYESVDEIEEALKAEYERETAIMNELEEE